MNGKAVPEYRVEELAPRRSRYCCAVFVINEGRRLHAQLERMRPHAAELDILVADGGSTDGSVAREVLGPLGVRALLVKTGSGKLSAQMRMAFDYALGQGYEGVIAIDGNDKDEPAALPAMAQALARGVDHVQGSRFVPGGRAIRTPISRLLGLKLLHAPLISLAAGWRYTDTTNGFRAYSSRFLQDPRVAPFREVFTAYELHYYLAICAPRLGFRVEELPVTRAYPQGEVPTKISRWKGSLLILRTLFAAVLGRFDPPKTNAS